MVRAEIWSELGSRVMVRARVSHEESHNSKFVLEFEYISGLGW